MAIQLSVAARDARLNAIEVECGTLAIMKIRSGAQPANCAAADAGTVLATLNLPSDWMAAAGSGVKAKAGTWEDAAADAAGTAAHYRVYKNDGTTCVLQGSVSAPAGGGDLELQNVVLAVGQQVTVTAYQWTDANA